MPSDVEFHGRWEKEIVQFPLQKVSMASSKDALAPSTICYNPTRQENSKISD